MNAKTAAYKLMPLENCYRRENHKSQQDRKSVQITIAALPSVAVKMYKH